MTIDQARQALAAKRLAEVDLITVPSGTSSKGQRPVRWTKIQVYRASDGSLWQESWQIGQNAAHGVTFGRHYV